MTQASRHDGWQAGDSYECYMGRWSRLLAPRFLDWLDAPRDLDWLEVGCGTGALSAAIVTSTDPASLTAIDPSEAFVRAARANVPDRRARFEVGDARALAAPTASKDAIVSGLVLNFVPDKAKALAEMKRVARPEGRVAFYVWDYAGGGAEFLRYFWQAAAALDPAALELTERIRFPYCTQDGLVDLARSAGLGGVESAPIETPTVFESFEAYWQPFTLGAGPAGGYCKSLDPSARERLKERLSSDLPRRDDGAIVLAARAWGIKTTVG